MKVTDCVFSVHTTMFEIDLNKCRFHLVDFGPLLLLSSSKSYRSQIAQMEAEGPEYCTTIDFIQPIGGVEGYDSEAVYTDSSGLTSITATNHDNDTIIFLGNSNGQLKKVRFYPPRSMTVFVV